MYLNFSTVEEYDPVADEWTEKADMPTARLDLSASAANGKIYAIGGVTHWVDLGNAIVEEYDTGFSGKNVDLEGKLPTRWAEIKSD